VTAFRGVDFFSDPGLNADPYPYYEYLRTQGPVCPILDRLSDIRLDEANHGPPEDRRFHYVPFWILRGLTELHIEHGVPS
jgi:hypothetical protein